MKMEMFKTAGKEGLKKLFTQFSNNLDIYTTVFVTVTYHLISERDFACSCKPQNQNQACVLHMVLPVALLWVLLLLLNKGIHRAVGNVISSSMHNKDPGKSGQQGQPGTDTNQKTPPTENKPKSGRPGARCCLVVVVTNIIYSLCVSLIWAASVFLDGDWYLCCKNDGSEVQAHVACKPRDARTMEEKSIAADLKSTSRNYGLVLLLSAAIMALTVTFVRLRCKKQDDELTKIIFEEGRELVFDLQHKAAMEQLEQRVKAHLEQKEWMKSFQAVEQLIIEIKDNVMPPAQELQQKRGAGHNKKGKDSNAEEKKDEENEEPERTGLIENKSETLGDIQLIVWSRDPNPQQ